MFPICFEIPIFQHYFNKHGKYSVLSSNDVTLKTYISLKSSHFHLFAFIIMRNKFCLFYAFFFSKPLFE